MEVHNFVYKEKHLVSIEKKARAVCKEYCFNIGLASKTVGQY